MKITCTERITRYVTVEVPDNIVDKDSIGEDFDTPEIRDVVYNWIDEHGWDDEYCIESSFSSNGHVSTIYHKG